MRRFAASSSFFAVAASTSAQGRRWLSYHNDYFGLLGVKRDVTVDLDALKKNYHSFQSQHHPDLHPQQEEGSSSAASSSSPVMNLKDATAYASNAYSVLKDPFLRCRYLRLLLEADAKAVMKRDKALLPTGADYYNLAVSHDASEGGKKSDNGGDSSASSSISEAVRADDKEANPVNHDQEFLMEMMELNMKLAEALEYDAEDPTRKKELDELKVIVAGLEAQYAEQCGQLYGRITQLTDQLLGNSSSAGGAMDLASASDVFAAAKNQFRDSVLKWTFASNLRRQINEAY